MSRMPYIISLVALIGTLIVVSPLCYAETKIIMAEATYTMGDGESPSFAEAMVLQKAKQMALEQAGTYVESYTKLQNYQLTAEEIQTIASGVLEVEVVEKNRTLVGDGLRFSIKIKATVTKDRMEELSQRIKGKNVAEEYKKLQEDYGKLAKEIEKWKQLIAKTPAGPEREAALDQIREQEKAFAVVQQRETALFKRLISGAAIVKSAHDERGTVDALLQKIALQGVIIDISEPTSHLVVDDFDKVKLRIPVRLQANKAVIQAIKETAQALGGKILENQYQRLFPNVKREVHAVIAKMGNEINTARYFQNAVKALRFVIKLEMDNGEALACNEWHENETLAHPFYLETNPIAPVAGIFQRHSALRSLGHTSTYDALTILDELAHRDRIIPPGIWVGDDHFIIADSGVLKGGRLALPSHSLDQWRVDAKGEFLGFTYADDPQKAHAGFKYDGREDIVGFYFSNFTGLSGRCLFACFGDQSLLFKRSDEGALVAVFNEIREFTVTVEMAKSEAKRIKAFTGIYEFLRTPASATNKMMKCTIEP